MKIIIDPNGGGNFYGYKHNNRCEKDDNLKFSLSLYESLIENTNSEVTLTRDDDTELFMDDRIERIIDSGADLCISIRRGEDYGLGYTNTSKDISGNTSDIITNILQIIFGTNIYYNDLETNLLSSGVPTIILSIYKFYEENDLYDENMDDIILCITDAILRLETNSAETIKNIENGLNNRDIILEDNEGYFYVGNHPGEDKNVRMKVKSFNKAKQECDKYPNTFIYVGSDPNAKPLYKSSARRITSYSNKNTISIQKCNITHPSGAKLYTYKTINSNSIQLYTYGQGINILPSKCDNKWVYVIDNKVGNGYVLRDHVSV